MARLDPLPMEQLSPEQKTLHAELGSTRNGRVSGQFAIWLRTPAACDAANKLALALRENGTQPPGVDEPRVYRARSGYFVTPEDGRSWQEVYAGTLAEAVHAPLAQAAE